MIDIQKPVGMKYTDMAIYVDNTVYKNPDGSLTEDEKDNIFIYLYLLCNMVASKRKIFHRFNDYEEFSFYAAKRVYFRLTNPKQYDANEPLPKVKSCLNFIKNTLYFMKVDWQNESFCEILDDYVTDANSLLQKLYDEVDTEYYKSVKYVLYDEIKVIPDLINQVVQNTPYKKDKSMCYKLYMSVLFTFIDKYTLRNKFLDKLNNSEGSRKIIQDSTIFNYYDIERQNKAILWKLSDSYRDYIMVLYNIVNTKFLRQVLDVKNSLKLSDNVIATIYQNELENLYANVEEEEI